METSKKPLSTCLLRSSSRVPAGSGCLRSRNPILLSNLVSFVVSSHNRLARAIGRPAILKKPAGPMREVLILSGSSKLEFQQNVVSHQGWRMYLSEGNFPGELESETSLALAGDQRNPISISEANRVIGDVHRQDRENSQNDIFILRRLSPRLNRLDRCFNPKVPAILF